jgi:hypothetical protein
MIRFILTTATALCLYFPLFAQEEKSIDDSLKKMGNMCWWWAKQTPQKRIQAIYR